MSRFWERIVQVTPPFKGTPEQLRENVESHSWRNVDLAQRFGVKTMGEVVECAQCRVLASSNVAYYHCDDVKMGRIPKQVSWDDYKANFK